VGTIFPVTVTNKGFVDAQNVQVSLSVKGDYDLEFLNDPYFDQLAPQQTAVLYAKFRLKNAEIRKRAITPILVSCVEVNGGAKFTYYCGPNAKQEHVPIFKAWGHCPTSSDYYGGSGSSHDYIGGPSFGHDSWVGDGYNRMIPSKPRSICQEKDSPDEDEPEDEPVPDEEPEETDDCDHPVFCLHSTSKHRL
jgi:hypothetical protein